MILFVKFHTNLRSRVEEVRPHTDVIRNELSAVNARLVSFNTNLSLTLERNTQENRKEVVSRQ